MCNNNTSISEGIYPPFQIQLFAPFPKVEKEKKPLSLSRFNVDFIRHNWLFDFLVCIAETFAWKAWNTWSFQFSCYVSIVSGYYEKQMYIASKIQGLWTMWRNLKLFARHLLIVRTMWTWLFNSQSWITHPSLPYDKKFILNQTPSRNRSEFSKLLLISRD